MTKVVPVLAKLRAGFAWTDDVMHVLDVEPVNLRERRASARKKMSGEFAAEFSRHATAKRQRASDASDAGAG